MLRNIFAVIISGFSFVLFSSFTDSTFHPDQQRTLKTIIIDPGHGLPDGGAQGKYSQESDIALAIGLKLGDKLKEVLPNCKVIFTRTDRNLPNGMTQAQPANRYRAQMANENHGDLYIAIHVNNMPDRFSKEVVGHKKETYHTYVGKGKSRKRITKTRTVPIYKYYKLACPEHGTETYIWAINKNDQKKEFVGSNGDMSGEEGDSTMPDFESPEAKILASIRTKKYFNNSLLLADFVEDEFKKQGRLSNGVKQRNYMGIWVLQATAMPSILVETGFICNPDDEDYLNSEKGQNEITYAIMRAVLRYKESLESGTIPDVSDSAAAASNQ